MYSFRIQSDRAPIDSCIFMTGHKLRDFLSLTEAKRMGKIPIGANPILSIYSYSHDRHHCTATAYRIRCGYNNRTPRKVHVKLFAFTVE